MNRHTDTAVFDENPSFKYALQFALPACSIDAIIAVMINLGEPLPICAFLGFFP